MSGAGLPGLPGENTPTFLTTQEIFRRKIGGEPPFFSLFIAFLWTNIFDVPIFFQKSVKKFFFCQNLGCSKPK